MLGKKNLAALIALVLLLTALVGCVQETGNAGLAGLAEEAESKAEASLYPNPDRDSYGIGIFIDQNRNPIQKPVKEAFVNLPAMPEDFAEKMHSMRSGNFNSIALGLEEAYFKQPEFLPKFGEIGLRYWLSPDLKRWGREGFGIYPADQSYKIRPGKQIYITAFLHSAYGIETFQGLRLYHFFPEDENLARFFSVAVEPESILLGPTYPIVDGNWMHRVRIKIKASSEAQPGSYSIGFNTASPQPGLNGEWGEKYGYKYVAGAGMFSIGRPRLRIELRVE